MDRHGCPRLVGRADDLRTLQRLLDRAAGGSPQAVLLTGEAGIGKTRLLDELVARVNERGGAVLVGGCVPLGEQHLPYAPIVEALRGLARSSAAARELIDDAGLASGEPAGWPGPAPGRPAGSDEQAQPSQRTRPALPASPGGQGRLFELFLGLLSRLAARGPVLVALEDLHWADRSTVSLLSFLHRHLADEPVLLVGTFRDDELPTGHPVRRLFAETARGERVTTLALRRLDIGEVAQHLTELLGAPPDPDLVDWVFGHSEGNPFFTEVLVAAVDGASGTPVAALPPTVTDLVLRQVRALTAETQNVLRTAAVAGPTVGHLLLAELTGLAGAAEPDLESALREAMGSHVLVAKADEGYAFRHVLIQQALYADLLPSERRRLHTAAARALTDHPQWSIGARTSASALHSEAAYHCEVAYHWNAAGERPKAFAATVHAGLAAADGHAYAEAYDSLRRAVSLWDVVAEPERLAGMDRAALLAETAHMAFLLGDDPRAISFAEDALAEVNRAVDGAGDDPQRAATLHERMARYHFAALREGPALAAYQRALALLPPGEPSQLRAMVVAGLARLAMLWSRPDDARRYGTQAIELGKLTGARQQEALGRLALGIVRIKDGDVDGGLAQLRRALEVFTELGDHEYRTIAHVNLGCGLRLAGRLGDSVESDLRGHAFTRRVGLERNYGGLLLCNAAETELDRGGWEHAGRLLDEAAAKLPRGQVACQLLSVRSRLAIRRGDLGGAAEALARLDKLTGSGKAQPCWELGVAAARAEFACWSGDFAQVREVVADGLASIAGSGEQAQAGRLLALGLRAEAELAASAALRQSAAEVADCRTRAARLLDQVALLCGLPAERGYAQLCRAEAARVAGEPSAAPARLRREWQLAFDTWTELQRPFEAAYCGLRLAEATLRTPAGAVPDARTALVGARQQAHDLGAARLVEEIDALARIHRLDLRRPPNPTQPGAVARTALAGPGWSLTTREVEVLRLVADGRSNREIGATLFITEKTASVHVSNILRKLAVPSRVEAAQAARSLGVGP